MNSILPFNELRIVYISLSSFSNITGHMWFFFLQRSYLQALLIFGQYFTCPGADLTELPTHWYLHERQNQQMSAFNSLLRRRFEIKKGRAKKRGKAGCAHHSLPQSSNIPPCVRFVWLSLFIFSNHKALNKPTKDNFYRFLLLADRCHLSSNLIG